MGSERVISASDFKAGCLDILDRLADRRLTRVTVTKRGRPVAVLVPPGDDEAAADALFGCMAGSVVIPAGVDLTAPVFEGEVEAARG